MSECILHPGKTNLKNDALEKGSQNMALKWLCFPYFCKISDFWTHLETQTKPTRKIQLSYQTLHCSKWIAKCATDSTSKGINKTQAAVISEYAANSISTPWRVIDLPKRRFCFLRPLNGSCFSPTSRQGWTCPQSTTRQRHNPPSRVENRWKVQFISSVPADR